MHHYKLKKFKLIETKSSHYQQTLNKFNNKFLVKTEKLTLNKLRYLINKIIKIITIKKILLINKLLKTS